MPTGIWPRGLYHQGCGSVLHRLAPNVYPDHITHQDELPIYPNCPQNSHWLTSAQPFLCKCHADPHASFIYMPLESLPSQDTVPENTVSALYGLLREETANVDSPLVAKWESYLGISFSEDNWRKCFNFPLNFLCPPFTKKNVKK